MKQNEKSYRWTDNHRDTKSWGEILEQLDKPRFSPSKDNKWGLSRILTEQKKHLRSND
jgi:hypothetical protein